MIDQAHVVAMSDPSVVKATAAPHVTSPAAEAASPATDEAPEQRRSIWKVALTMAALAAMSGLFLFFPIDWEKVGNWGYLGVFLVTFVATASFILPIPYLLIVARAAFYLDPLIVTLVAGLAGALGELTGYIIGASGRDLIAAGKWYDKGEPLDGLVRLLVRRLLRVRAQPGLRRDRVRRRRAALLALEVHPGLLPREVAQVLARGGVAPGPALDLHGLPPGVRRVPHGLVRPRSAEASPDPLTASSVLFPLCRVVNPLA